MLVVAPAGFGKTSILADWAEIDGRPFAWLSLGTADNDRMVLWAYIAAALTAAGGMTWTSDELSAVARVPDPVGVVIAHMRTDQEMVLVLDDYHAIESEACHESVLRFIELAPANLQVAISSRTAVPLPLARRRASGALIEIGSGELRFTAEESDAFLNGSLALGLDDGSVVTLTERTEGWPAGLYLAYLSIRRTKDRAAFISGFGGKNRLVGEYLTEQVLKALGPAERDFMLVTSVVDEVNGPLADALTGSQGSSARLVELERANVFITPLDDRREWYRYHHLLLELLRLELAQDDARNASRSPYPGGDLVRAGGRRRSGHPARDRRRRRRPRGTADQRVLSPGARVGADRVRRGVARTRSGTSASRRMPASRS